MLYSENGVYFFRCGSSIPSEVYSSSLNGKPCRLCEYDVAFSKLIFS